MFFSRKPPRPAVVSEPFSSATAEVDAMIHDLGFRFFGQQAMNATDEECLMRYRHALQRLREALELTPLRHRRRIGNSVVLDMAELLDRRAQRLLQLGK